MFVNLCRILFHPGHAGFNGCFGNRCRNRRGNPFVKGIGYYVIFPQILVVDQVGNSIGRRHLHLLIDFSGTYVDGAAEYAREYVYVVNLVGGIAAARAGYPCASRFGKVVHGFRNRIGQ